MSLKIAAIKRYLCYYDNYYGLSKGRMEHTGCYRYAHRVIEERGTASSTPRWVKVFGIVAIVLFLLVGIMVIAGSHGPGAHAAI